MRKEDEIKINLGRWGREGSEKGGRTRRMARQYGRREGEEDGGC